MAFNIKANDDRLIDSRNSAFERHLEFAFESNESNEEYDRVVDRSVALNQLVLTSVLLSNQGLPYLVRHESSKPLRHLRHSEKHPFGCHQYICIDV